MLTVMAYFREKLKIKITQGEKVQRAVSREVPGGKLSSSSSGGVRKCYFLSIDV